MTFLLINKSLIRTSKIAYVYKHEDGVNNIILIIPKENNSFDVSSLKCYVELSIPNGMGIDIDNFYCKYDDVPYRDGYLSVTVPIAAYITKHEGNVGIRLIFTQETDDGEVVILKSTTSSFEVIDTSKLTVVGDINPSTGGCNCGGNGGSGGTSDDSESKIWYESSTPSSDYKIWAKPKSDNTAIRLTYSNERVEQTVGNVKVGEKFENEDIVQILDRIFAASYTKPSISIGLSCKTLYDKDVDELTSITITANVTKKTEDISYVKFYVGGVLVHSITTGVASGGTFKFTYTPDTPIKSTTVFKVETCDKDTKTVVSTQSYVTFVQKSYWGVVPSILSPTDNDVITVLTSGLKTSVGMTQKFTTEFGRFVFAYPKAIGSVKSIKDNVNNFNYTDSCSRGTTTINGGAYEIIYLTECAGFEDVSITFA